MSRPDDPQTLFADAVAIPEWLEHDREARLAARLHRDRTIASSLAASDPVQRVRGWWRQVQPEAGVEASDIRIAAARLEHGRRLIALLMVIAGAVAGIAAAAAVLRYDGTWPVNVVTVLAILVLLQLFLIALTLLLMLPRVPGLAALQDLLGSLNPGAIVAAMYRRARRATDRASSLLDWRGARGPTAAHFAKWQMLAWSQLAAVSFNIAVLATAGGLIAFTDLAFGWSTTLHMTSDEALRITDVLCAPWRRLWPEAVPDAQLIEASRFFRLASAQPANTPAAALTGWWPFLLASVIAYGLAPRCVMLALAAFRLRAATVHLLLDDPRVRALLDRMQSTEIALGAPDAEAPVHSADSLAASPAAHGSQPAIAIVWSAALPVHAVQSWAAAHLRWRVTQVHEAGGGRSLSLDEALIERLASERPAVVLIFVRAWEAPLLDLRDFLALLRSRVGRDSSFIVAPIGPDGTQATDVQRTTWSRWSARIGDPALYLETGA